LAKTTLKDHPAEVTISVAKAYMYSAILIFPLTVALVIIYDKAYGVWHREIAGTQFVAEVLHTWVGSDQSLARLITYVGIFTFLLLGVIIHEALHGLTWGIFCKHGLKSISYGMRWDTFTPYAHCKEPLTMSRYRLGAAMPGILLGLIPIFFGFLFDQIILFGLGIIFLLSAGGDIAALWVSRHIKAEAIVQDHPDKIGILLQK
jgi:hypothetical protein